MTYHKYYIIRNKVTGAILQTLDKNGRMVRKGFERRCHAVAYLMSNKVHMELFEIERISIISTKPTSWMIWVGR